MVEEGKKAPVFRGKTDGDGKIALSDFKGRKLVLYFYPKDDTPGCTKEAVGFTERAKEFAKLDTAIVGVSRDTVAKHDKFKNKYDLAVTLLSDEDGSVCEKYGVWVEKKNYGRTYMGIERSTFLIDEKGVVRKAWRKVRVNGHVDAVLEETKLLRA